MAETPTTPKVAPDWELIELDYRAGLRTLREIAADHGISHVAIAKRAKRDGWSRDLAAKIAAKADELVTKASVTKQVTNEQKVTERELIDANAQAIVSVRLSHRKDISRTRNIVMTMMAELEATCGIEVAELLAQLGEMMREPDEFNRDKFNDMYRAIASLPGRAKTMKDLAGSLSVLIDKEREAFNIDAKASGSDDAGTPGADRTMTNAERAIRLSRLMGANAELAAIIKSRVASDA